MTDSLHLLLIDDSEDESQLILRNLNTAFTIVSCRVDTLEKLKSELTEKRWDFVLCEHKMPLLTAADAVRTVKEFDIDLPVIVVSGTIGEERTVEIMKEGAHDVVIKDNLTRLIPAMQRELAEAEVRRERGRAELALRERDSQLGAIASNIPGAVYRRILDTDGTISLPYVKGGLDFVKLFGHDSKAIIENPSLLHDALSDEDQEGFKDGLQQSAHDLSLFDMEWRLESPDGEIVWLRNVSSPTLQQSGEVMWDGILLDISAQKQAEIRLEFLNNFDPLTELPNRTFFIDRLDQAISHTHRSGDMIAVLALGMDRLKTINETLGHDVGDKVLKEVGRRIADCLLEGDSAARLGGDEFAVLLTSIRSASQIDPLARKIVDVLTMPILAGGHHLSIAASVGISVGPLDGSTPEMLIRCAETALHRAKAKGPKSYQFFTSDMNSSALKRLSLEAKLRRALERDEFTLHYQPQVNMDDSRIVGVEALIRWRPDGGEMIPPFEFIPIAEETGMIVAIGEWVLWTACRQLESWQSEGLTSLKMSVNVAPLQLQGDGFALTLQKCLSQTGLGPGQLELELTESTLMSNLDDSERLMKRLNDMHVSIAIDDFGTGYSSLSYLSRFPVSSLKIDRSFVITMTQNSNNAAIVSAITTLARSLDMSVVAEGVDSEEQLTFLRAYRCDTIQGFYFSRPVPAVEIPPLIALPGLPGGAESSVRQAS